MAGVLVVYDSAPARAAVRDHLDCFRRHSGRECYHLNTAVWGVPWFLSRLKVDLVVFHTLFLAARWGPDYFRWLVERARALKGLDAVRVAIPQDEFFRTDLLCDFINELAIDCVFSTLPPAEWPRVYSTVNLERVKFVRVLTGYLDDGTLEGIGRLSRSVGSRPIDIGYRAFRVPASFGRHALLKLQVADRVAAKAPANGLRVDISTRPEDTILGEDWYRFLLRCKYTIGVEGGASLLDRDGSIARRTEAYVAAHPGASFEEIEAACFPGLDGSFRLCAISPRHLEACATRTCQVLVEGEYNGVLEPGTHYIELKRDFRNLDQVLDLVKRDHLRADITERAYADVVASGRYTYRGFVELVLRETLGMEASRVGPRPGRRPLVRAGLGLADRASAHLERGRRWVVSLLRRSLPTAAYERLRAALRRAR